MIPESTTAGARYERIRSMIARDECVILDGAMGTELIKVRGGDRPESERRCEEMGVGAVAINCHPS